MSSTPPSIDFVPDSWPPTFLASGFATSLRFASQEQANTLGPNVGEALRTHLAGIWHSEVRGPGGYPIGSRGATGSGWPLTIQVGFSPILANPEDDTERGRLAEALAGLLTGIALCPDAIRLVDWGLANWRRARYASGSYHLLRDAAAFASRADAYAAFRALRTPRLGPWLDGGRAVRNLATFREMHVDMPDDEALVVAAIWEQARVPAPDPSISPRAATAVKALIDRGWIASEQTRYTSGPLLTKTARYARRLPQVEALAF